VTMRASVAKHITSSRISTVLLSLAINSAESSASLPTQTPALTALNLYSMLTKTLSSVQARQCRKLNQFSSLSVLLLPAEGRAQSYESRGAMQNNQKSGGLLERRSFVRGSVIGLGTVGVALVGGRLGIFDRFSGARKVGLSSS